MNAKWFKIYCCVVALILTVPLVGTVINFSSDTPLLKESELSGVNTVPTRPEVSLDSLLSGKFESSFEEYFTYHLFSRKTQTRVYNQLLYLLFRSTDNQNMLVGREDYIFEKPYATAYLMESSASQITELKGNIKKMQTLTRLLKKRGIILMVRMSPSKTEVYSEYLPSSYDRFMKMKHVGEYASNWYEAFCEQISKTDIPYYDGHDLLQEMKNNGEIVFTKGGTHWSLAPMEKYVNGLNAQMEKLLDRKLGRMVEDSKSVLVGQMGIPEDSDIWQICWNAISVPPNYASPNITYTTLPGDKPFRVFTVGQSFTTVLLSSIYNKAEQPVWEETDFSWYNSRVMHYPSEVAWGTQISDQTNDFERYLSADVILVEFLQNGDGYIQFQFVDNLLQYLAETEVES